MYSLLSALAIRPRRDTDAFTIWCGFDPYEVNIWTVEGSDALWPQFRAACHKAGIVVSGRAMDGFTYSLPRS